MSALLYISITTVSTFSLRHKVCVHACAVETGYDKNGKRLEA